MNALESNVLRLIGENLTSPDVFTDDDSGMALIRGSLNDAIEELNMVSGAYSRRFWLATSEDQPFYRLAPVTDHIVYIKNAWDRETLSPLKQTDFDALRAHNPLWLECGGSPTSYCYAGFKYLILYPVPTGKGKIIDLECVCIPSRYTADTDIIKLREQYRRAAVYFAISEYFASRGDAGRATEYGLKYLETAGLMQLNPQTLDRTFQFGKNSAPQQGGVR